MLLNRCLISILGTELTEQGFLSAFPPHLGFLSALSSKPDVSGSVFFLEFSREHGSAAYFRICFTTEKNYHQGTRSACSKAFVNMFCAETFLYQTITVNTIHLICYIRPVLLLRLVALQKSQYYSFNGAKRIHAVLSIVAPLSIVASLSVVALLLVAQESSSLLKFARVHCYLSTGSYKPPDGSEAYLNMSS